MTDARPGLHRPFARRETEFRPSPVRAVFELAMDPAYVSLAGGNPDTGLLPTAEVADLSAQLLRERGAEILQYGSGAGADALREAVVHLMAQTGSAVSGADVLATTGSQMGLDLVTKLFCDPGDVVIAEGPTYVGAMGVFGSYEVDLRQVPVDDAGMDPDQLAGVLDAERAAGRTVRFVYVIPHHQNPSGVTLTAERRRRVVEVCAARDVLVLEDDPYAFVGFPGNDPLPSLHSLHPEGVVHLGSMSKLFAPGLRVGWIVAPPELRARLQLAGEAVDIHPSALSQEVAAAWVTGPRWRPVLDAQRAVYAERCRVLLDALGREMPPGVHWTEPSGGFFTWLTLPGVPPGTDLLGAAIEQRLVLVPGDACFVDPPPTRHVRLAFSSGSDADLIEGARRLGAMVRAVQA
ncbi:PLP-dependent aminotransferase family protein [Kytococcus sedentarius]|uniref:aminotransferase-like domain-containing protein n=1 Tax=Kytococcus sedentarius TaxID=1276 RepID=UPI0035BC7D64